MLVFLKRYLAWGSDGDFIGYVILFCLAGILLVYLIDFLYRKQKNRNDRGENTFH